MMVFLAGVLFLILAQIHAMPYNVPLHGSEGGKRTVVILDDMSRVQTNSIYFNNLERSGHELSYFQASSPELKLKKYGVYLYDNIVMFNADDFNTITFDDITEFVNEGGNVLVSVDGSLSPNMRIFAEQSGIDFDAKGSSVIDHFSYEPSADTRYVLNFNSAVCFPSASLNFLLFSSQPHIQHATLSRSV